MGVGDLVVVVGKDGRTEDEVGEEARGTTQSSAPLRHPKERRDVNFPVKSAF